jgi:hypothetical protein
MRRLAVCRYAAWVVLCVLPSVCAASRIPLTDRPDDAALTDHRAWWQAYSIGDQTTLADLTAPGADIVFASGARLPRAALIEEAGNNARDSGFSIAWSDESVRFPRTGLALVSATATARAGVSLQVFRITAVLDRVGESDWKAVSIQSTRVARFAPGVSSSVSGPLEDYVGAYTTPRGRLLTMEVREEGTLWMVEPDGKAIALAAVGPGLFEAAGASPLNGVLRLLFARDGSGRVVSCSRLTEGHVAAFPRAK